MIGIESIACAIPSDKRDNLTRSAEFGLAESFIRGKVGFVSLTKASGASRTSDLAKSAVERLVSKVNDLNIQSIDCLIVCTQNPDGNGLPNTASILHGDMGFAQHCVAFDISLGCSGYVYGLSIIQSFMQANGLTCGVLVTSDPYSKIVDEDDRDTAILFGDGATATLLRPDAPWKIGRSVFGSDGTKRDAISVNHGNSLSMNGRGVFAFTAQIVPEAVKSAIELNSITADDIDLFLMHQGSLYIVSELRKRLEVPSEKMPFGASETGNLVSSSIPVLLQDALYGPDERILLAGFGVGLSWGVTIIERAYKI